MTSDDEIFRIHDPEIDLAQIMRRIDANMQTRSELPPDPGAGDGALFAERRAVYRAVDQLMEQVRLYGNVDVLRGGVKGRLEGVIKQTIRKTIQRHIDQQDAVHKGILALVDRIVRYLDATNERLDAGLSGGTTAPGRQSYPACFPADLPLLDLQCGRGDFLALLGGFSGTVSGIDTDAVALAWATNRGLSVSQATPAAQLAELESESLGGLFAGGAFDSLAPDELQTLLLACQRALVSGGVLIVETAHATDLERALGQAGFEVDPIRQALLARKP